MLQTTNQYELHDHGMGVIFILVGGFNPSDEY